MTDPWAAWAGLVGAVRDGDSTALAALADWCEDQDCQGFAYPLRAALGEVATLEAALRLFDRRGATGVQLCLTGRSIPLGLHGRPLSRHYPLWLSPKLGSWCVDGVLPTGRRRPAFRLRSGVAEWAGILLRTWGALHPVLEGVGRRLGFSACDVVYAYGSEALVSGRREWETEDTYRFGLAAAGGLPAQLPLRPGVPRDVRVIVSRCVYVRE